MLNKKNIIHYIYFCILYIYILIIYIETHGKRNDTQKCASRQ